MCETEGLKNDIIYQFYYIALFDYEKGNNLDELKMIMHDYNNLKREIEKLKRKISKHETEIIY